MFDASGRGTVTIEELQTRAEVQEVEEEGGNETQKNETPETKETNESEGE